MFSQKVSDVQIAENPVEEMPVKLAFQQALKKEVESCSNFLESIIPVQYHAFLAAAHMAYDEHRPLVLSPDILWLTIAQGVALHVNNNAEELRHKFVDFEGKQEIWVRNDTFIKGALENPWESVFSEFSDQIREKIGADNHDRLVQKFTTTGPVEIAANEVVLMDTLKNYFSYGFKTCCGIPEIVLEGEKKDYAQIRDKAVEIGKEYDLQWWMDHLVPILDRIADEGVEDTDLWENWYKISGGSGGPFISGHVINFYPYLHGWGSGEGNYSQRNEFPEGGCFNGIGTDDVPPSLNKVPFKWQYHMQEFQMAFLAGFIGVTQDKETMAVRPKIGWAVMDENASDDPNFFRVCSVCEKKVTWHQIVGAGETVEESNYTKPICRDCYYELDVEDRKEYRD